MNLLRDGRNGALGLLVWLGAGMAALAGIDAQSMPFSNNFDYVAGTTVQSLTNSGWDASSSSVQVQTNVVCVDTSSVVLPQNTVLTNWVAGVMTNVWTDFHVQMEAHNEANEVAASSNAVIQVGLDRTGYLQVYDKQSGWLTLSNTVRGAVVTAYTNGQWGRVTLFQNYATQQCAVFLDGVLIKERLPFGTNVTACSSFRVESGNASSSYFDNFSMTRAIPAGLPDAQEIDDFGYLAPTLNVGPGQAYTTIQSAINAALDRYVIHVTNGSYTENVTINHALGGITGGVFTINGSLAVASGLSIYSRVGFTSGDLSVSNGSVFSVTGSLTASNTVTCTGAVLTVSGSMTNRDMTLGTNSITTIGQNLRGNNLTLQSGARLTVGGTLSVTGAVTIAATATLVANGQVAGHDVTISGGLVIGAGGGLTATNLTLGSGGTLTFTNANVTVSNLVIGTGASLVVSNGTVVANGMTFTGSFTLDEHWGNASASSVLPYQENFDIYQPGLALTALDFRGWGASDSSVAVEQGRYISASNGVDIGFFKALSNRVNAVGVSQVWTDFRAILNYDANDLTTAVNSAAAFMAVVTTNGYLSLYNRLTASWEICTNDIWRNPVARQTGQWSRVSVLCDYNTKKCAVFLDSALLRQEFPFINPGLVSNSVFSLVNEATNAAALDNFYVGATYPASLTNDVNGNDIPDALEILRTDDILSSGSVFRIR